MKLQLVVHALIILSFVKSMILDKLIENKALIVELTTGETISMGVLRIGHDFEVVHYTGKGLREIWKPDMNENQKKEC